MLHCNAISVSCNIFGLVLVTQAPWNEKQEVCTFVLVKTGIKKFARKVAGRVINILCNGVAASIIKSRAEFYFVHYFTRQKKLRDNPCYTVQFSSNFSRNSSVLIQEKLC